MLTPDPRFTLIRSENDAIDYVTRLVPPSKEQYAALRSAISNPVDEEEYQSKLGTEAVIKNGAIQIPAEQFNQMLDRVYETTVQRYRAEMIAGGIMVAGMILIGAKSYKSGYRHGQEDAGR